MKKNKLLLTIFIVLISITGITYIKLNYITRKEVKTIILKDLSINEKSISNYNIVFTLNKGNYIYKVDFKHNNTNYEYRVSAKDGSIITINKVSL